MQTLHLICIWAYRLHKVLRMFNRPGKQSRQFFVEMQKANSGVVVNGVVYFLMDALYDAMTFIQTSSFLSTLRLRNGGKTSRDQLAAALYSTVILIHRSISQFGINFVWLS